MQTEVLTEMSQDYKLDHGENLFDYSPQPKQISLLETPWMMQSIRPHPGS